MNIIFSIVNEAWLLTLEMAPYLLLGFLAAGFLHVFIPIDLIGRHLGKESVPSVFKASLFGLPIPLCSCGVLPVAASIRKSGASRSSTLSFLITTPVTGVDSLMATWALLGWVFTAARLVVSIIIGFFSGFIMTFIFKNTDNNNIGEFNSSCNSTECCSSEETLKIDSSEFASNKFWLNIKEIFHYAFIELPASFSGSLLLGLILAGIISFLLPPELIKQYFGPGILGIIVATIIAVPLYVCSTGSIPIAAAMITTGFSPGAALAFLIAGPATNTVAFMTVKKLLGNRAMFVYLFSIFIGAIGFGLLFDLFNIKWQAISIVDHKHQEISIIKLVCAFVLLSNILILYFRDIYLKYTGRININEVNTMNTLILSSPDISCQHCAGTIKKTLSQFSEIEDVKVDVNSKNVSITLKEDINKQKILSSLEQAGYPSVIKEG